MKRKKLQRTTASVVGAQSIELNNKAVNNWFDSVDIVRKLTNAKKK